jgi:hypothetical protein
MEYLWLHPWDAMNEIAPPRWRLNGCWHCTFLQLRDCSVSGRIPIKLIAIDDVNVMGPSLGESIYKPPRNWWSLPASRKAKGCGEPSWQRSQSCPEVDSSHSFQRWIGSRFSRRLCTCYLVWHFLRLSNLVQRLPGERLLHNQQLQCSSSLF